MCNDGETSSFLIQVNRHLQEYGAPILSQLPPSSSLYLNLDSPYEMILVIQYKLYSLNTLVNPNLYRLRISLVMFIILKYLSRPASVQSVQMQRIKEMIGNLTCKIGD